jgi:methyltransferase (TIGR00027 family)
MIGDLICRTRYIDDVLIQAIREGVKNIVILGAGLDTRAYRIPGAAALPVTGMDLPEVLGTKRRLLEAFSRPLPGHLAFAPVDLTSETLEQALRMGCRGSFGYPWRTEPEEATALAIRT